MAIHPDDPAWPIFGLPRIIRNRDMIRRFLDLVDSPYNGLTFCTGSLGTNPDNDLPAMIREFHDRIHFAHIRNVKVFENGDFIEVSHRGRDGSVDVAEVVKAYHENGYIGYVRPDHGRHLWGKRRTADRVMACMIELWASCICLVFGIAWIMSRRQNKCCI